MNIAVIGGAGFVGSAFVRRLHSDGQAVTVFDNFSRGGPGNLPEGVAIIQADARDGIPSLYGFEQVYDFAARVYGVRDLYKDPAALLTDNIRITTASLEAVALAKVPRYLFVSSSCVYDFEGARVPHVEEDMRICNTSYGFSKQVGENLTAWYARQYGFTAKIARLFNVYGPGDSLLSPHVIPEFLSKAQALRDGASTGGAGPDYFHILGSGHQTRDFTYMDDVVDGLLTIAAKGEPFQPYNVGTGREVAIRDLAEMVCAAFGMALPPLAHEPVAKEDIQRRAADNRRLRALGWEPKVSLEDGLRRLLPVTA